MRGWLFATVLMLASALAPAVLADTPKSPELLLVDAKAAADKYEVEKAVALYTEAIESGRLSMPQLVAAYTGRAEARDSYADGFGIKDAEMVLALRDYRKARELMTTAMAYLSEGRVLITLGAYNEAAAQFRSARRLEQPSPHWSLISLARVERIQGRYDAAITYLEEALRLEGTGTMPIHYHWGRALFLQGKYAEAVGEFTKGLVHQPDYSYAFIFRACANAHAGNAVEALKDMEKGIQIIDQLPKEEWDRTPAAQSNAQDRARDLAAIKAMNAGGASEAERATLCKSTWNDGDSFRTRSPLLNIDDLQVAQLSFTQPPPGKLSRACRTTCDKP